MAKKNPVLKLSTTHDRDFIMIDDLRCDIRGKDELSIVDYHRISSLGKKIQKTFDVEKELSEDEISELQETLDKTIVFILSDAPEDVLNKINDTQKLEIILAFTELLSESLDLKGAKEKKEAIGQN